MSSGAKIILAMLFMLGLGGMANAATVTPASGGGAIASNTAPGCSAEGTWTVLSGPSIAEAGAGEIGTGTIVLSAPGGFEFNTAATVTVQLAGSTNASKNINSAANGSVLPTTVTASSITFTVTTASANPASNTLTWQGIQVRPTAATPLAGGNITHSGTSAIAGVTGATNFGTLSEFTSTPECILTTPTAPSVTTNAATALTETGATLNGTVSSNLAATTASFEYGLTASYGSTVAAMPASLPADAVNTAISAPLTGLVCGTTYHFRAVGVNSEGTGYGGDLTFTTSACPPQVTLTPASGGSAVPSNTAPACGAAGTWTTLTGPVAVETAAAQIGAGTIVLSAPAGFEFNPAAAVTILLTGSGNRNNNINNVATGTAMATTVTASTITFTVTAVSAAANTLTWQNIQVRPTLYTPLASGNITHTGTSAIAGVTGGVTNFGTLTEVTSTPACHTPPTAITNAATGITFDTATLNGTVSSNGADTTVSFEWGLTTAYGETIPAIPGLLLASAVGAPVSADLIGLNCNTQFHYRVVATNSAGTSYGADGTFVTGACTAPFPATACAATRYGEDLGCTSADVGLTNIAIAPGSITSCVSGTPVMLDLDLTVNFSSPNRYDVGIFIANDGKLPTLLPANGGSGSCSVDVLPTTPPFLDLDGVPQGTLDTCGDGNSGIDDSLLPGGTLPLGDGVKRMTGVTLPCYAGPASGGKLFVPFVVTWDSQRSPLGFLCTSNLHPVPNTKSRCSAPASSVSINVVVLPVVTKSDGISEINPGANTTYSVTITNNSGGTLQDVLFTDPAVTDPLTPLTVNSVSCASNGGATCPAMTSAAMIAAMQGAGILIPSASLPSTQTTTSSLTFTISATLSGTATVGSHLINTASVTVGGYTVSATDDDLIVLAPSVAKSFAPSTITEGAASLLTITLTNPTASAITGVSFTDIYPAGMVNAAAANPATTCGGTVTAVNGGNSLALSGGTIPAKLGATPGSCTVTVNVTSAAAGSYTNSTGIVTHASGSIPAASAVLTVNVAVFGAFNVCNVGTPCTNTTGYITTKIAGAPFSLDIVALNTNGTRNTNYSNTVLVELLDASNNGGALDSYNCRSTWTVIATLAPNPSFSPANNGLLTVGLFTVPEAYRDVRVRVRNSGGPARIGCSTDNFAIRPASIAVSVTDADWQTAGTARVLNNADALGAIVHKAGQPFTVTATALNVAAITTANYAGTPALTVGDCTPGGTACTASLGTFALGVPSTFASGVLASNVASYSEAGAFSLTLQDNTFASVDALDTAASCAGYYVCSAATAVGRFVPDHFAVASLSITEACATATPFTYLGQDGFVTEFTLAAENANNQPTLNYAGDGSTGLAKLPISTAWGANPGFVFSASAWNPAQPAGAALAASASVPLVTSGLPWVAGSATFTARHQISRPAAPAAPTMVTVSVLPVDSDGVTMAAAATVGTSVQRFGRLRLSNAFGSSAPLLMPVEAQYWSGLSWVKNSDDSCTALAADNLLLDPVGWPAPASFTLAGGSGDISLAPTGPGSVSICADLGADPVGGVICLAATSAGMPWLQSRWPPGIAYDNDPSARATFGIYAPETRKTIHIREQF